MNVTENNRNLEILIQSGNWISICLFVYWYQQTWEQKCGKKYLHKSFFCFLGDVTPQRYDWWCHTVIYHISFFWSEICWSLPASSSLKAVTCDLFDAAGSQLFTNPLTLFIKNTCDGPIAMALGRSWRMQRKALFFVHLVLWSDHGISALRDSLSGERDFLEHDNQEASCLRLVNLW